MKKYILFSIILCFASPLLAQDESSETSISEHFLGNFEEDWMIVLGFGRSGTKVDHTETSSVAGFSALGVVNDVGYTSYSLSLIKELFHQSRLSLSLIANANYNMGGQSGSENNIDFSEDLSGFQYGLSFSVNLNYFAYNMKLQPYLGAGFQMENSTLDMDYVSGANNIKTTYNYTGTIGQANLGVRILDPNVGLMSFLNISYVSAIGETIDAKVNVGGSEGVLDVVDVSKSNIHASLGFGFIF